MGMNRARQALFLTSVLLVLAWSYAWSLNVEVYPRHRRYTTVRLSHPTSYIEPDFINPSSLIISSALEEVDLSPSVPVLLVVGIALGIVANGWIQKLLSGEQGLGAYLSDGSGYNKSSFRVVKEDEDRAVASDPLPWLRLPNLDFVEVAGQQPEPVNKVEVIAMLDELRAAMDKEIRAGNMDEAEKLRTELEALMEAAGVTAVQEDDGFQ